MVKSPLTNALLGFYKVAGGNFRRNEERVFLNNEGAKRSAFRSAGGTAALRFIYVRTVLKVAFPFYK